MYALGFFAEGCEGGDNGRGGGGKKREFNLGFLSLQILQSWEERRVQESVLR